MTSTDSETGLGRLGLPHLIGKESVSSWHVIDQHAVDQYVAASGDGEGEWIHLDPERAARETDYGGTIVPGFLQVANLTRLFGQTMSEFAGLIDPNHALNYGFDKLRFVAPLPVGAPFRARITMTELRPHASGGHIAKQNVTLEREDGTATLIGEWLFYMGKKAFIDAAEPDKAPAT